jgi:hypothetical protein
MCAEHGVRFYTIYKPYISSHVYQKTSLMYPLNILGVMEAIYVHIFFLQISCLIIRFVLLVRRQEILSVFTNQTSENLPKHVI